jgi:hypothetical protein
MTGGLRSEFEACVSQTSYRWANQLYGMYVRMYVIMYMYVCIYCTAMAVLVGLQTTPLNLSLSLFPTSPSVLQSLCYERFSRSLCWLPPLGCRSSIQLLTAVFAGWLTDSPAKLQTEELKNCRTDSVGVGVQPKVACGEPSRSHQSQPFRNALL